MSTRALSHYRAVHSHGAITDASPTRLIQLVYENLLTQLTVVRGCMERIKSSRAATGEVTSKGVAIGKVNAMLGELAAHLDLDKGGTIAGNLLALYSYMMTRLTYANLHNDPTVVDEISSLVREIKSGWDQIVSSAA